jgi:hypothetical protein
MRAGLPPGIIVERLAAAGFCGAADYLFRIRDGMRANGTPDAALEDLAARVEAVLIAGQYAA